MLVSFGWTSDALIIGAKTCTRRIWAPQTVQQIARTIERRDTFDAWNTSPRNVKQHPAKIATCRLKTIPYLERGADCPDFDYHREGFGWLAAHGYLLNGMTPDQLWRQWKAEYHEQMYVVRFEEVSLTGVGLLRKKVLEAKGWGLR